jgi:hypothetical protein
VRLAVAWCSFFTRPGLLSRFWIRDLQHAYRPPALFVSALPSATGPLEVTLTCDALVVPSAIGSGPEAVTADLLYFSSHGQLLHGLYRGLLTDRDWFPTKEELAVRVVVLDTCELGQPKVDWSAEWVSPQVGSALRLVLGFEGLASDDQAGTTRGLAFAQYLNEGMPFVAAWFASVTRSDLSRRDRPVALAIGDSVADAEDVLTSASLHNLPAPRTSRAAFAVVRP